MPKAIEHITREEAVSNVARWALERNWTLKRCAEAMGLRPATLRGWMHSEGWSCQFRRMWVKDDH